MVESAPVALVTGSVAEAYVYEAVSDDAISGGRDDIAYELRDAGLEPERRFGISRFYTLNFTKV